MVYVLVARRRVEGLGGLRVEGGPGDAVVGAEEPPILGIAAVIVVGAGDGVLRDEIGLAAWGGVLKPRGGTEGEPLGGVGLVKGLRDTLIGTILVRCADHASRQDAGTRRGGGGVGRVEREVGELNAVGAPVGGDLERVIFVCAGIGDGVVDGFQTAGESLIFLDVEDGPVGAVVGGDESPVFGIAGGFVVGAGDAVLRDHVGGVSAVGNEARVGEAEPFRGGVVIESLGVPSTGAFSLDANALPPPRRVRRLAGGFATVAAADGSASRDHSAN